MSITEAELNAFHQFAQNKLIHGVAETLHELVEFWEIEHLTPEEHAENVSAVQVAIRDMENGDTGRAADEISNELRAELTHPE